VSTNHTTTIAAVVGQANDRSYFEHDVPNQVSIDRMQTVVAALAKCQLDVMYLRPSAEGGLAVSWFSPFNVGHYSSIEVTNDGVVMATSYNMKDHVENGIQIWWVKEFIDPDGVIGVTRPFPGELQLTLEETIERIRVHIWADYKNA